MIYPFHNENLDNEMITRFIDLVRLNKHVKLNKTNPNLKFYVRDFIESNDIHPNSLVKAFDNLTIITKMKEQFPIEVIDGNHETDFHWMDNR